MSESARTTSTPCLAVCMRSDSRARVDVAFSREQPECIYLPDHLRTSADMVRTWNADGAAVLVWLLRRVTGIRSNIKRWALLGHGQNSK